MVIRARQAAPLQWHLLMEEGEPWKRDLKRKGQASWIYGGSSGLVTIEDLLERIVGDIQDEYDLEEEWLVEEPAGTVVVDARLPIEELEEYFEIEVEREKFDT